MARSWAGTHTLADMQAYAGSPRTFEEAHRLWTWAFAPHQEMELAVEAFMAAMPRPVLGVHWRGTDKVSEATFVEMSEMITLVEDALHGRMPARSIFVACLLCLFPRICFAGIVVMI